MYEYSLAACHCHSAYAYICTSTAYIAYISNLHYKALSLTYIHVHVLVLCVEKKRILHKLKNMKF